MRYLRFFHFILVLVFVSLPASARADVNEDLLRAILRNDIPSVFRLVQAGADLNARSRTGNTPLHEAAALGHRDIVQILVDGGASASIRNNAGYTPLDWATRRGYPQIADLIREALARRGPSRLDQERERVKAEARAPTAPPQTPPNPDHARSFLSDSEKRDLQSDLQTLGHYDGAIDGLFGPGTNAAISAWQAAASETPTGRLDAKQYAALRVEAEKARLTTTAGTATAEEAEIPPAAAPSVIATIGAEDVLALEEDLALLGFDPGAQDGVADDALAAGVTAWQAGNGEAETGDLSITQYALVKRQAREARDVALAAAAEEAEARLAEARAEAEARAIAASTDASPEELRERAAAAIAKERRVALIVGNGAYAHAAPLANPLNDAADMAAALSGLNFDVTLVEDGDLPSMRRGLRDFAKSAADADIALFFYAGHGVQVEGENFLLPVDAAVEEAIDLEFEAMSLNQVLDLMNRSGARLKVALLDACRDDPIGRSFTRSSGGRGLARVETSAVGAYVAFATSPGAVAADGEGRNSPFTAALLEHLPEPDVEIGEMFRKVRKSVLDATDGRQLPWSHDSVVGSFYFGGDL